MRTSISRSVGRAFAVMELFARTRRPATATEISRALNWPHSSAVAVLLNLMELGYLSYRPGTLHFFPTEKLWHNAAWLRPALHKPSQLGRLLDSISAETGQTTTLLSRVSIFLNTVITRPGGSPTASRIPAGIGVPLAHASAGLSILSQLDDAEVGTILNETGQWIRQSGARPRSGGGDPRKAIDLIRRRGRAMGKHPNLPDVNVIAYPMPSPFDGTPLSLAVNVPAALSPRATDAVCTAIESRLQANLRA